MEDLRGADLAAQGGGQAGGQQQGVAGHELLEELAAGVVELGEAPQGVQGAGAGQGRQGQAGDGAGAQVLEGEQGGGEAAIHPGAAQPLLDLEEAGGGGPQGQGVEGGLEVQAAAGEAGVVPGPQGGARQADLHQHDAATAGVAQGVDLGGGEQAWGGHGELAVVEHHARRHGDVVHGIEQVAVDGSQALEQGGEVSRDRSSGQQGLELGQQVGGGVIRGGHPGAEHGLQPGFVGPWLQGRGESVL